MQSTTDGPIGPGLSGTQYPRFDQRFDQLGMREVGPRQRVATACQVVPPVTIEF